MVPGMNLISKWRRTMAVDANGDVIKERKSDQNSVIKNVLVIVLAGIILGGGGFLMSFAISADEKFAPKEKVEKLEEDIAEILTLARKIDKETGLQKKDIDHIKEKLDTEVERSAESDKEIKRRIRAIEQNGR